MSHSSKLHGLQPARLLHPWNFPGKNTGVGCYSLLQGIFVIQESNPGLLNCRQTLYHLSHQGITTCEAHCYLIIAHEVIYMGEENLNILGDLRCIPCTCDVY